MTAAYCTLINPERSIPQRQWISPGLTDEALRAAPTIEAIEPELARRINGKYLVGHNVSVDWRLLHRRCPTIKPVGLIDTLRLARRKEPAGPHGLAALIARHGLTRDVHRLASSSIPHRALWDTVACAMLLTTLTVGSLGDRASADVLLDIGGISADCPTASEPAQPSLFD
jgi:DNA polymerase-3 subunit epsilon